MPHLPLNVSCELHRRPRAVWRCVRSLPGRHCELRRFQRDLRCLPPWTAAVPRQADVCDASPTARLQPVSAPTRPLLDWLACTLLVYLSCCACISSSQTKLATTISLSLSACPHHIPGLRSPACLCTHTCQWSSVSQSCQELPERLIVGLPQSPHASPQLSHGRSGRHMLATLDATEHGRGRVSAAQP